MPQQDLKEKARTWLLHLYPDNEHHSDILIDLSRGYSYVAILHDKDLKEDGEPAKPHVHAIVRFGSPRYGSAVRKEFDIEEQFIERVRDFNSAALYLTHEGQEDKYHYDTDELFGPLTPSVVQLHESEPDVNGRVKSFLELVKRTGRTLTVWDLIELACDNGCFADFMRLIPVSQQLCDIHNSRDL